MKMDEAQKLLNPKHKNHILLTQFEARELWRLMVKLEEYKWMYEELQ